MDPNLFDDLARSLAANVSRRQMLKALLGGAGAGLVALIGLDRWKGISAAAGSAAPSAVYQLFVPLVLKACTVASTCVDKVYCSANQVCRCIKSAEGPILCGKVPSCDILHCKTSADCASLGPGYFCDTPYSGCCNDAAQQRCIAPCIDPTCPPERICGTNCCPEGQVCTGKICCAATQACGTICCPTGMECIGGRCVVTCANDPITSDSILAAKTAIASGATQVSLSPGGCLQYNRTFSGTTLTYEEIRIKNGYRTVIWTYSASLATGRYDQDLDGFAERRIDFTRGATPNDDKQVITEYSPSTHLPTYRTTLTRTDQIMHVLVEHADSTGVFQIISQYDQSLTVDTLAPISPDARSKTSPKDPNATCTAAECDEKALGQKLHDAVVRGQQCLRAKKEYGFADRLMQAYLHSNVNVKCFTIAPVNGETALAQTWTAFSWLVDPTIVVNVNAFCNYDDPTQMATLFHESMHLDVPSHDPDKRLSDNRSDVDRIYACTLLCFASANSNTQCSCATCLGTTKCDPRCSTSLGFQTCSDDFGAYCFCPIRRRWYKTCGDCTTYCPSGLTCFGYRKCDPVPGACVTKPCP